MIKIIYRFLILIYSKFFKTDELAETYPVSVKGIFKDNNRFLLVKNEKGYWDFPGGKIEKSISVESTLIKEFKEELNLDISVKEIIYFENEDFYKMNLMIAIYNVENLNSNPIHLSHEHIEFDFFEFNEIDKLKVPDWVKSCISV